MRTYYIYTFVHIGIYMLYKYVLNSNSACNNYAQTYIANADTVIT